MRHTLGLFYTAALCALLAGCVGATRLPVRDRGPAGDKLAKNELDLTFLDSPTVHRDEVVSKLNRIDTGCNESRFFWGRWAESKWGYWWFVAGQTGGAGDAKRIWHIKNLLVTFNEDGTIHSKQVIVEERILWRQLRDEIRNDPPLDSSKLEVLALEGNARRMTLTPTGLEIDAKKGRVRIAPEKIVRFSHVGSRNKHEEAGITCHSVHFAEKTLVGRKITFCGTNNQLLGVFRYLDQVAPKNMMWE